MIFKFITDVNSITDMELACMAFNLGLLYFLWDIYKYIRNAVKSRIRGNK